jgi:hypothetical protein
MSLTKTVGRCGLAALALAGATFAASSALAADHRDGAAAKLDPSSDINDTYAFMNEDRLVLAMTVHPFAESDALFSSAVQFVWTVDAHPAFAASLADPYAPIATTQVHCEFDDAQIASCWVHQDGEILDYLTGDASAEEGIESSSGATRIFAGLRADPFYFYLSGFNDARQIVIDEVTAGNVVQFANGCPDLSAGQLDALGDALVASGPGAQDLNDFLGANTLVIVAEVDSALFTNAGAAPVVGVRASTHEKP